MKLTQVVIFILTILLSTEPCRGQSTFSKRYAHGYSTVFTMLMMTDYGYLVIGEGRDTVGEYSAPLLAVAFNEQGEWISTRAYGSSDMDFFYDTMSDSNIRLDDSTFVILTAYYHENTDTNYVAALWLNEYGDTLRTRKYTSPYYLEGVLNTDFNGPAALAVSEDGGFLYYATQIFHSSSQNNFMIKKLTAQGDEVWTYIDSLDLWYNSCNVLSYYNGQVWFVSQSSGEQGNYNKLMRLNDTTGVVDFEVEHSAINYIIGGASDMIIDSEGYCVTTPAGTVNHILPHMFKVDYSGEYLWYTTPNGDNAPQQQSDHLVKSPDGGYVSCSVKYEEQINPNDPNDPAANNTSEKIWLWKVDSDGNFLWQRFYEYLTFDSGYFYLNNTAFDMKTTPDGGFIMAGEATARCLDWPCLAGAPFTQQGWLLKVDACGCLVPGCDSNCIVSVEETEVDNEKKYFRFGPNPVGETLNIFLASDEHINLDHATLELRDLMGRLIRSLPLPHNNTTYIIDASSLSSGEYILSLHHNNLLLQSEKMWKK